MGRRALRVLAAAGLSLAADPGLGGAAPELPAFPGAEGFGAGATGGRGGEVVLVDTLAPFGPGSLGDALDPDDCGPRVVVFRVSGVVEVPGKHDLELTCGDLTIAGQTAPGAGITVHGRIDGYGADPAGNLVIRHLRVRPPPLSDEEGAVDDVGQVYDALQLSKNANVILDHVSLSWGSDEVLDLFEGATDVTVQWSTIEASNLHGQPEGPHNHGLIAGPDSPRVSVHHVLFAHHRSRCPAMASGPAEIINNVVYDCQDGFVHHNPAEGEFHIVGNTFIHGPSHEPFTPLYFDDEEPGGTRYRLSQNALDAPGLYEGVLDDIRGTPLAEAAFGAGAHPAQLVGDATDFSEAADGHVPISVQSPDEAMRSVLARAGAFPRDEVTRRTVRDVTDRGGAWGADEPADLLEGLSASEPPADDDRDGMADEWESARGLDPRDGGDHASVTSSGYTAIEEYVNGLSDRIVGASAPAATATTTTGADGDDVDDGAAPVAPADPVDGGGAAVPLAVVAVVVAAASAVAIALKTARSRK